MIRDDKERIAVSLQLGVLKKLRKIELLTGISKSDIISMLILNYNPEEYLHNLDDFNKKT